MFYVAHHMLEHRVPHVAPEHSNTIFSMTCRSFVVESILYRKQTATPFVCCQRSYVLTHMLEHNVQHVSLFHQKQLKQTPSCFA